MLFNPGPCFSTYFSTAARSCRALTRVSGLCNLSSTPLIAMYALSPETLHCSRNSATSESLVANPIEDFFPPLLVGGINQPDTLTQEDQNFEKPISLLLILASAIIALCNHGHQNLSTQTHHNLLTEGDEYWECNEKCGMWWLRSFNRGFGGALDMSRTIWPICNPDRKVFHIWEPSHTQILIM